MSNFSDMLGYLRKRGGLSQKELAEKIGVSRSTIGMYEAGDREPNFETLEAIADTFNVNMDTLLGKTREAPGLIAENQSIDTEGLMNARFSAHPNLQKEMVPPEEARLLELHRRLNEEGQARLRDYADDLVSSGKYERDGRKPALIAARGDGSALEGITSIDGDLSDHEDDLIP